jgi:hypothetical protein
MVPDLFCTRAFPDDAKGQRWTDAKRDDLDRATKAFAQCSMIASAVFSKNMATIQARAVTVRDFGGGMAEQHAPKLVLYDFANGCYSQMDVFCVEQFGPWAGAVNLTNESTWSTNVNPD